MSSIPEEIHQEILLRLPVESVLRFKSVCKNWYGFITSPKFIKDHLSMANINLVRNTRIMIRVFDLPKTRIDKIYETFYSIDYASISSATSCKCDGAVLMDCPNNNSVDSFHNYILGSCNGLILLDNGFLWNPSTREYKEIIGPSLESENMPSFGFGYADKIDKYKLVCIANGQTDDFSEVHVYTLESSESWRRGQNIPYINFDECPGLLVNGALHWLGDAGDTATHEQNYRGIISFDINSERIMDFPFPKDTMTYPKEFYDVQDLGGSLCLVRSVPYVRVDVWVMQSYGVIESWTKKFTTTQVIIRSPRSSKFYHLVENDEILIYYGKCFCLYDPKNDKVRFVHINGTDGCNFAPDSYVQSLVSLSSGTYMGKKITNKTTESKKRKATG